MNRQILGVQHIFIGPEVQKDAVYSYPQVYKCKLDDGKQYLISSINYSGKSENFDASSAIGLIAIPQPNGVVIKSSVLPLPVILSYDGEMKAEDFEFLDFELANDGAFKARCWDGDYEVGAAVLLPENEYIDTTF